MQATAPRPKPSAKSPLRGVLRFFSRAMAGSDDLKGSFLALFSSGWFLIFILLPSLIVLIFGLTTFNPDLSISYSHLTWSNYIAALDPTGRVMAVTLRTLWVSAATTVGSLIVYYPVAYYMARIAPDKHRGFLISLVVIPFWISFVVYVYAIFPWVQRTGYVGWFLDSLDGLNLAGVHPFHTPFGSASGFADWLFASWGFGSSNIVIPALIYLWGTYMIFPLFTSLLRIDRELLEAAQNLGAGPWRTFWTVTFPLSFRGVMTGSILVFISAFSAYVEPATLAGQDGHLIGNSIYNLFNTTGNLPFGAAVSVVVIVITVVLLYFYTLFAEDLGTPARGLTWATETLARLWQRIGSLRLPSRPEGLPDGGPRLRPVRGKFLRFYDRLAERRGRTLLAIFFILNAISWYVPLAQVVLFSFNYGFDTVHWDHFSLRWYFPVLRKTTEEYPALFADQSIMGFGWPMGAMWNSFLVGVIATVISLALGIPAAMAIARYRFWYKRPLNLMVYTGLVMPSIVMGVSILVFINFLDDLYLWPILHVKWLTGFSSIIVGHVTFCIPVVIVVLVATFQEFDRSLEEAAMNLGANEITTFAKVTLPVIAPGIVSAALLAFTFSFGEVVVTTFLKGQGVATLPVIMWSWLSHKIPSPELNAASTLVIGLSFLFVLVANKVQRGGTLFRF